MNIRQAVLRLINAQRELILSQEPVSRVTASIVRVEVVKKDAAGNIIARIVDGDYR